MPLGAKYNPQSGLTKWSDVIEDTFYTVPAVKPGEAQWNTLKKGVDITWTYPSGVVSNEFGLYDVDSVIILRKATANGAATKVATFVGEVLNDNENLPMAYRDSTATDKAGSYFYDIKIVYTIKNVKESATATTIYDGRPLPGVVNCTVAWVETPKAGAKLTWDYPAEFKTGYGTQYQLERIDIQRTGLSTGSTTELNVAYFNEFAANVNSLPKEIIDTTAQNGGMYNYIITLKYKPTFKNVPTTVLADLRFAAPVINPHGGAVAAGTKATATKGNFDSIFVAVDTNAFVKYTANAEFTISKATRLVAYGMKNGFVSKYDTVNFTIVVANEAKELAGVRLYPNPTKGEVNVVVPVNAMMEVFAANGMQISRKQVAAGNHTLQINTAGVYFVRVTAADGATGVKRVVVR